MSGTRAYVFCAFSIRKETAVLSSEEVERQVYYNIIKEENRLSKSLGKLGAITDSINIKTLLTSNAMCGII